MDREKKPYLFVYMRKNAYLYTIKAISRANPPQETSH